MEKKRNRGEEESSVPGMVFRNLFQKKNQVRGGKNNPSPISHSTQYNSTSRLTAVDTMELNPAGKTAVAYLTQHCNHMSFAEVRYKEDKDRKTPAGLTVFVYVGHQRWVYNIHRQDDMKSSYQLS